MDTKKHLFTHASNIVVLLIILLVIVGIIVSVQLFSSFNTGSSLNFSSNTTPEVKKAAILDRLSAPAPLTSSERQLINVEFSPANVDQYHLSNADMERIVNALNK